MNNKMLAVFAACGVLAAPVFAAPANPCAKNPCAAKAANPCAAKAKNPCARNPCAAKHGADGKAITRPAGYKPKAGDVALGEKLFADTKLSTNGLSCNACHQNHGAFAATFAKPYPHAVAMASERMGVKKIHLDEMVQACMVMPMEAKPLAWDSAELAALTDYTATLQKSFKSAGKAANPCAKNPCAAKAANPCAKKAMNPCAKK